MRMQTFALWKQFVGLLIKPAKLFNTYHLSAVGMTLCSHVFVYVCFAVVERKRCLIWWTWAWKYILRGMRESLPVEISTDSRFIGNSVKFISVVFCRLLNQSSHLWPITINAKPCYQPIRTRSQNIWWVPSAGKHAPGARRGKTCNMLSTKRGKTSGQCKGRENTLCSANFVSDWWNRVFSLIN